MATPLTGSQRMPLWELYLMYKNDGGRRPYKSWARNPSAYQSLADAPLPKKAKS